MREPSPPSTEVQDLHRALADARTTLARQAIEHQVSRILASATSVEPALHDVVRAVRDGLGVDFCAVWLADGHGGLRSRADASGDAPLLESFVAATRALTLAQGVGLPGRVWQSGRPHRIEALDDDPNFPRRHAAVAAGLHSGVAVPLPSDRGCLGVIEWFHRRAAPRDTALLDAMAALGSELGQFLLRRRVEEQLLASEKRFRTMANTTPAIIWTADARGAITFHNQRWLDYTGSDAIASAEWHRLVHQDDRERCLAAWTHALETGSEFEIEVRSRRRDGEYRWFLTRATPIRAPGGAILEWYGSTTDIHDRKLAEQALAMSEDRYRRAAEAANALVYEVDLEANERAEARGLERIVGEDATGVQLTSSWWRARIHPDDLEAHVAEVRSWLADPGLRTYRAEYRVHHTDGTWRDVEDVGRVVRDHDGRPLRLVGTIVDVTKRKQAERSLLEADRRKDDFLAMLGHELRNPLAPISNALHLLRQPLQHDAVTGATAIIERQVRHLVRLVDDLLDVSRVSRGKITLHREVLALDTMVQHAVETCRPLIRAKRQQLNVRLPAAPLRVDGDPTRLAQIAGNLLHNAAKYTGLGGHIEVTLEVEGAAGAAMAVLRVRDDGRGISPDELPHVFEPFFQADRGLDRAEGGLGIGLSLVQRLVALHGGSVHAHSDGPGRGCAFTVRLPLVPGSVVGSAGGTADAAGAAGGRGCGSRLLRILVVDDNEDSTASMACLLRMEGHELLEAHDGRSAVDVALRERPDVVLCDLGLPYLDGYQACRAMRSAGLRGALIVAMTGYCQEDDLRATRAAGFDDHLVKPVDLERLHGMLLRHAAGP